MPLHVADSFETRGTPGGMSSLERVMAVVRRRAPDRVPHFEWSFEQSIVSALAGGGDYFDFIERMDVDALIVAPAYRRETIEGGMLRDEWGSVRVIGQDHYALVVEDRVPIRNEADLARWTPPDPHDPYRYEPLRKAVERFGGKRAIIFQARDVWSPVRDYLGYERALVSLLDNPKLVEAVAAQNVEHYSEVIKHAAQLGANIVLTADDLADNRAPLFSPRVWTKVLLPHYRKLVRAIHDAGLYHWKHSDGNMMPLLDSIVDAGTDGIDPIDPLGGMDLAVVKARYGDRVAIKGNVDQIELLVSGTPEQVAASVRSCIRAAGAGGGYVCSSSNSIHSGVDPRLYTAMVSAIHQYGRYPLQGLES